MESVAQAVVPVKTKRKGRKVVVKCSHCGQLFERYITSIRPGQNQFFCSPQCNGARNAKTIEEIAERYCLYCNARIVRDYGEHGGRKLSKQLHIRKGDTGSYCNRRCYGDHTLQMNQQKATMFFDVGTLLVWEYKRQTMYAADCYLQTPQLLNVAAPILWLPQIKRKTFDRALDILSSTYKKRFKAACRALVIDRRVTNDCVRCGCQFTTTKVCVKMCKHCRAAVYKKQQRHRKRCEAKGLPYDPALKIQFIGDRANWICEICNKPCLKQFTWLPVGDNPYGKVKDMSPTQDHIVPLNHPENWTHGHTAENTQLACHQCNGDKNMNTNQTMIECHNPRHTLGLPE
jgi:hypothetical protein